MWPPPDCVVKRWTAYGLECAVVRGTFAMNGYVRVDGLHPAARAGFDADVNVHGGVTFSERFPDGHWVGFDTAHAWDYVAHSKELHALGVFDMPGRIWTVEDVAAETEMLAEQLAAIWAEFVAARGLRNVRLFLMTPREREHELWKQKIERRRLRLLRLRKLKWLAKLKKRVGFRG